MKKRFGFTLAEVLITLGIIGVVAAMTIPTLIANTNSQKFRSQFKKSISTLNQAGLMGEAQFDMNYGGVNVACQTPGQDRPDGDNARASFCALINGTLTGQTYLAASPYSTGYPKYQALAADTVASPAYVTLADGSMVVFPTGAPTAVTECAMHVGQTLTAWLPTHMNCLGFIDVNGRKNPNMEVKCGPAAGGTDDVATTLVSAAGSVTCTVPNDTAHMGDIFPVAFHDATVEPATNAAKAVLSTAK